MSVTKDTGRLDRADDTPWFTKSLIPKILSPFWHLIHCLVSLYLGCNAILCNLHGLQAAAVMQRSTQPGWILQREGATLPSHLLWIFWFCNRAAGWHSTVQTVKTKMLTERCMNYGASCPPWTWIQSVSNVGTTVEKWLHQKKPSCSISCFLLQPYGEIDVKNRKSDVLVQTNKFQTVRVFCCISITGRHSCFCPLCTSGTKGTLSFKNL